MLSNFVEIALRHGHERSPVNLQHIFRTRFLKNTTGRLLEVSVDHTLALKVGLFKTQSEIVAAVLMDLKGFYVLSFSLEATSTF